MPVGHVRGRRWPSSRRAGTRAELLGVLNMRGQILAVADLAPMLGITAIPRPGGCWWPRREAAGGLDIDEVGAVREVAEPDEQTESAAAGTRLAGGELIGSWIWPRVR